VKLATVAVGTAIGDRRRVCVVDEDATAGEDAGASGAPNAGRLVDVTTAHAALLADRGEGAPVEVAEAITPPTMRAFLRRGERAMEAAREALAFARETDDQRGPGGGRLRFSTEEADVSLLAPIPRPNSLRDCMAFEEHVDNSLDGPIPDVWYDRPVYYKGNPDTVVGPGATVEWPDYSDIVDYELELAAVVGRRGEDVAVDEAASYLAGFTVMNDFSARDTQGEEMEGQLGPAKGKDFASALGPYLVTPEEVDLSSVRMVAEIDGETVSEGTPGEMYHSFAEILAYVSRSEPLVPGDVIGSGTVGRGCGLETGRFLEAGETVSLTVEGIGTLSNRVVR
jgi:2-keto-4-pentenoate hydratase/2-oxohepta-3-ene-1,7-dioic acid hydratase in catechol pathway